MFGGPGFFVVRTRTCYLPDAGWLSTIPDYTSTSGGNYTVSVTLYNNPSAPCDIFAKFIFASGYIQVNTSVSSPSVPTVPELPYSSGAPSVMFVTSNGSEVTFASFVAQYTGNTVSGQQYGYVSGLGTISHGISLTPTWSADYSDLSAGSPQLIVGQRYWINMLQAGGSPLSGANVTNIMSVRHPVASVIAPNSGPQYVLAHSGVQEFYTFAFNDPGVNPVNVSVRYTTGTFTGQLSVRISGNVYSNDIGNNGLATTMNANTSFYLPSCFLSRANLRVYWTPRASIPVANVSALIDLYAQGDSARIGFYMEVADATINYVSEFASGSVITMSNSVNSVGQLHHLTSANTLLDTAAVLQMNHTGNGDTTIIPSYPYSSGSYTFLCGPVYPSTSNTYIRNPVPVCSAFDGKSLDLLVRNTAGNATYQTLASVQVSTIGVGINTTVDSASPRMVRGPSDPNVYPVTVQIYPSYIETSSVDLKLYMQRAYSCGTETNTAIKTWTSSAGGYAPYNVTLICPTQYGRFSIHCLYLCLTPAAQHYLHSPELHRHI